MKKLFRILLAAGLILLILLLAGAGAAVWKWRQCAVSSGAPELLEKPSVYAEKITIADKIPVQMKVRTPWARTPVAADVVPGAGSQLPGKPVCTPGEYGWGTTVWTVSFQIQPWKSGEIPEGSVRLELEGGSDGKAVLTETIPAFVCDAPEVQDKNLTLAGEMKELRQRYGVWIWVSGIACVLVLAAVLFILFRRHRRGAGNVQIPLWVQAQDSIRTLQENLHAKHISAEKAVTELNDVVRHYLELRFHLRVQHQTTGEFLYEMKKEASPLQTEHREFLGDFLTSSDMVKFARLPADAALFDDAAAKAGKLIQSTVPVPQEKTRKEKQNHVS